MAFNAYTHKIEDLVFAAKLKTARVSESASNPAFDANWREVCDWAESARYERWTEQKARELFAAVTDPNNGVLPWIEARW